MGRDISYLITISHEILIISVITIQKIVEFFIAPYKPHILLKGIFILYTTVIFHVFISNNCFENSMFSYSKS